MTQTSSQSGKSTKIFKDYGADATKFAAFRQTQNDTITGPILTLRIPGKVKKVHRSKNLIYYIF